MNKKCFQYAVALIMFLILAGMTGAAYYITHFMYESHLFFYRYVGLLALSFSLYGGIKWYNKGNVFDAVSRSTKRDVATLKWLVCLFSFCVVSGVLFSFFLHTAWMSLDSWVFYSHGSILNNARSALNVYISTNARGAEFLLRVITIPENMWQNYIITPMVCLFIPYTAFRLLTGGEETFISRKGVFFYVFFFFLLLFTVDVTKHSYGNFCVLPIAANYLWPVPFTLYFLSCFRKRLMVDAENSNVQSLIKKIIAFLLGFVACCGPECVCVLMLPLLVVHAFYTIYKKIKISEWCLWGYMGAVWGAFFLFASPGIYGRAMYGLSTRKIDFSSFSSDQLDEYFRGFSLESYGDFVDFSGCVNFSDLPLWYHLFFIPCFLLRFYTCCRGVMLIFSFLFILHLTKTYPQRRNLLFLSMLIIAGGLLCSASYLMGGIPTPSSYQPGVIILSLAAALLFLHLPYKIIPQVVLISLMGSYLICTMAPVTIRQWAYKQYEQERFAEIHRQLEAGAEYIVLPAFPEHIMDDWGMLALHELEKGFTDYPNAGVARRYGVKGVRQEKMKDREQKVSKSETTSGSVDND